MSDFATYPQDKHATEQVYIRYCELIDQKDSQNRFGEAWTAF